MKKILILILPFLFLFTTGCSINIKLASDKGVLISEDFGESWQQKNKGYVKKKIKDILSGETITCLKTDPVNPKRIYLCTKTQGLFVSEEKGEKWKNIFNQAKQIEDVVINPKTPDIIYLITTKKIYKTTNGGETWMNIYTEPQKQARLTSLALDFNEPNNIFLTTSLGILKSENYGNTWKVSTWIKGGVKKIYPHPNDSKKYYAITYQQGLFKTSNKGEEWVVVKKPLENFSKQKITINNLLLGKNNEILIATNLGLLRSEGEDQEFRKIETLLQSPSNISTIGINPKNSQEIYFTAKNVFYKSLDSGRNWTMRILPISQSINVLTIDPDEPRIIYLGTK